MYTFWGPKDFPCVTLGNTKGHEGGRTRVFWVTQKYLSSTIYIPSKLVLRDFWFLLTYVMILHGMNKYEIYSLLVMLLQWHYNCICVSWVTHERLSS